MKFSEKIYDKYRRVLSTSSDICEFTYPSYTATGMGLIEDGVTNNSSNVYLINSDGDFTIDFTFLNNLEQLNDTTLFNYSILPFNKSTGKFDMLGAYRSSPYNYDNPTHQETINTSNLVGEGEYIFKVGFQFDSCVEVANKLGKRQTADTFNPNLPYGNYDKNLDKYFVVLYNAEEPRLDIGVTDEGVNNDPNASTKDSFFISPLVIEHNTTDYIINVKASSEILITFNGSFLTKDQDYTLEGDSLKFFEPTLSGDIINLIYIGRSNSSSLKMVNLNVNGPISQGPTDGQGEANVYYNTDSEQFEVYTDYRVSNEDSVVVMINGQVLNNKIDYYVSESNKKRIILSGDLYVDDVLTIIYDSGENLVRGVTTNYIDVNWYVTNPIKNTDGDFIVEFSKYKSFVTLEKSETVPYVANQLKYTKRIDLNYEYGQVLYYRVRNVKRYVTINGDNLDTEKTSDVIRIEIKTNISNNY
jgi:hypothetical protein